MQRNIRKIEPLVPKVPAKKRVAAYARVSSGKDAMLHSLSAQISNYSEFIQKHHGWEYAGVYADEAITGTKDSRAEFQQLLTDCRDGKIDMVITKSISRFTRNTVTMLEVVRELKNLNIDVFFEKENIHSMSGDGELMLTILASFAQEESRSVSENCKWRIRKRFAVGEIVNLRFIFGYRIVKGEIEIEPKEAEIVRMIFNDYIGGMGCTLIANKLREMGVQRLRGGAWNSEKYAGNALLQKKYVADHLTKSLLRNKGVLPKYYAQNTHPPIVDEATFQRAQEIMSKSSERIARKNEAAAYFFTSKIVCSSCGNNYKRKIREGRVIWNCATYLKYGRNKCNAKQIPESILRSVTTDVLGIEAFDETIFKQQIKEIQVPQVKLLEFVFYNGKTIRKEWNYISRSESWNAKKRQQAKESQLNHPERRGVSCVLQEQ